MPLCAKAGLFGLALSLTASVAFAQEATTPFDMSGERGPAVEKTPEQTGSGTTAKDVTKDVKLPEKKAATPDLATRRYIIPAKSLLLEGETAGQSFPVFLTPQQAGGATSISLGYSNAVLVAPESSRLTVIVNDVTVGEVPVQSAEGTKDIRFDLPAGLLRPGINRVSFNAIQRHRTDCTIRSTYDLWTALDPTRTYLTVPADTSGRLLTTDDIAAIGLGPTGQTKFVMVVPEIGQPASTNALMRLSQGLALMAKMPNQTFAFAEALPATAAAGELTVLVGTAGDLAPLLPGLPATARTSAVATFVDAPAGDRKVFVVSGPDWPSIEGAVEGMVSPIDRPLGVTREALSVRQRNASEMPLVTGASTRTLASFGARTSEFSGRRFRTGFDLGIPSDFYADAYGEARRGLFARGAARQPRGHLCQRQHCLDGADHQPQWWHLPPPADPCDHAAFSAWAESHRYRSGSYDTGGQGLCAGRQRARGAAFRAFRYVRVPDAALCPYRAVAEPCRPFRNRLPLQWPG
jgi:cellulose synthase operon protein B